MAPKQDEMDRPTRHELDQKLLQANDSLQREYWQPLHPVKFRHDFETLDICDWEEAYESLTEVFKEVTADNYVGKRPPESAYEQDIKNCELFAFCFDSIYLGKRIYLKFAFKKGNNKLIIVSFHLSKLSGEEGRCCQ